MRLHIFGASGSGVTTTGQGVARKYDLRHVDTDDLYWQKTDPPFTTVNPVETRWALLDRALAESDNWLISGSMDSWCDPYLHLFDLVVFLDVPTAIRMARLREREARSFGDRILPGGDMYENVRDFLLFAEHYDVGDLPGRSRPRHEAWMKRLRCPILRIEGAHPVEAAVALISREIDRLSLHTRRKI